MTTNAELVAYYRRELKAAREEIKRLRIAEAEAMSLVFNHEGHIAKQDQEIERLKMEIAVTDEENDRLMEINRKWVSDNDELYDEIDRLRSELIG